ncbi:MAG: hypothetical protein ACOX3K_02365 [Bacilli bacterium]
MKKAYSKGIDHPLAPKRDRHSLVLLAIVHEIDKDHWSNHICAIKNP